MSTASAALPHRFASKPATSMNAEETIEFLKRHHMRPFDPLFWEKGDTLLVAFDEDLRKKIGRRLLLEQNPSLVRLEKVTRIDTVTQDFLYMEGWLNYYAIEPVSQAVRRVKVGWRDAHQFYIEGCSLFMPDDTLFVPGSEIE